MVVSEDNFITHERNTIQLVVPQEAQTGQIILSDGEELPNLIYSEDELVVTLPSVENVVNKENAKPGDLVEISGQHLDLVRQVIMPDGTEVEFTLNNSTEITFALPESTSDGDIVAVPASGVEVVVAHVSMAVPTDVAAVPASGLRGGDEIVLTGTNLDVVTDLSFPGVDEAIVPTVQSEHELKVVMPEKPKVVILY